jgi:hypothetical protein
MRTVDLLVWAKHSSSDDAKRGGAKRILTSVLCAVTKNCCVQDRDCSNIFGEGLDRLIVWVPLRSLILRSETTASPCSVSRCSVYGDMSCAEIELVWSLSLGFVLVIEAFRTVVNFAVSIPCNERIVSV